MVYSSEFINKVRIAYKNNIIILNLLVQQNDENSMKELGKLLNEGIYKIKVDENDIISAYENDKIRELYEKAKEKKLREEVYNDWLEIYSNHLSNIDSCLKQNLSSTLGFKFRSGIK